MAASALALGLMAGARWRAPRGEPLCVTVEVDFGPARAGAPPVVRTVEVPHGSTALDATRVAAEVRTAFVCCDPEDVAAIDGVACDPENEGWWLYEYNGLKGPVSAHRLKLLDGDRIRWHYRRKGSLKAAPPAAYREIAVIRGGSVEGRISLSGAVPDLPPFAIHKNAEVCAAHRDRTEIAHPCRQEAGKELAGAVVWLSGVAEGKPWGDFPAAATLDQRDCAYVPHLLVVRKGGRLEVRNSDPLLHTVHAYDEARTSLFNLAQAGEGSASTVMLDRAGVLDLICDAGHRWMKAHVVVADSPYCAVAGPDGTFRLDGVPPGTCSLVAWHHQLGKRTLRIEVRPGEAARADVAFSPGDFQVDLRYTR